MGRLLSRHNFGQVVLTTMVLTVILVFGAWLTQSLRFIEVIVEKDVSMGRYLSMVGLLLPDLMSVMLPICTLLATVYVLHKLIADHEVVVYKSIGLSHGQIAAPFLLWGVFVMGICVVLNNYLGPKANEQFYGIRNDIAQEFSSGLLRDGAFNKLKDVVIYVGDHTDSGQLEGIYIYEQEKADTPSAEDRAKGGTRGVTIFAQHGFLQQEGKKNVLYLFNGNRQSRDPLKGTHVIAYFNEFKYDFSSHQEVVAKVKLQATYGFSQLLNPPTDLDAKVRFKMLIEVHRRIQNPLFVITFVVFAAAILLSGQHQRRGRWKRVFGAVGGALGLQLVVMTLLNNLNKNKYAIVLSYGVLFVSLILSFGVLVKPGGGTGWRKRVLSSD
jgi:lipopolysaccharide export system permease protein